MTDNPSHTYTPCGGCGATHPDQRCIGCLHYFGTGSWDTGEYLAGPSPSGLPVGFVEAAYDLSTWAACINWSGKENREEWLDELREKIERVQGMAKDIRSPPVGFDKWFDDEIIEGRIPETNGGANTWLRDHMRRAWEAGLGLAAGKYAADLKCIYDAPYLAEGEMRLIISHPEKGTFDLIACPYIMKES